MNTNRLADLGRLIGEPARAAMLTALMDGRAYTAGELARVAHVTPQTASTHLARLTVAGLLGMRRQGRHRYHALANADVARLLERVMEIAGKSADDAPALVTGPKDEAMRLARTCYDHFAGRLGVAVADALIAAGAVELHDDAGLVTPVGTTLLRRLGIDAAEPSAGRPICRVCLDWSERRPHLGGSLGAAICRRFLEAGYVRRIQGSRAVTITAGGRRALLEGYGIRDL